MTEETLGSAYHELTGEYVQGDWLRFKYGYEEQTFYVIAKLPDGKYLLNMPERCVNSATELDLKTYRVKCIGHTKKKWYWKFLPQRNLICPFYIPKAAKPIKPKKPMEYLL